MTIKELRKASGMTQAEFAEYFGISVRTIEAWESRRSAPEYLVKLMEYKLKGEGLMKMKEVDFMEKIIEKFKNAGCTINKWFDISYSATVYTAIYNGQRIELKYLSCVMGASVYVEIEEETADMIIDIITKYEPKAGDKVLYRIGDDEDDVEKFEWGRCSTKPTFYFDVIGIEKV